MALYSQGNYTGSECGEGEALHLLTSLLEPLGIYITCPEARPLFSTPNIVVLYV